MSEYTCRDTGHAGRNHLYFVHQIFYVEFVGQAKEDFYVLGVDLETTFQQARMHGIIPLFSGHPLDQNLDILGSFSPQRNLHQIRKAEGKYNAIFGHEYWSYMVRMGYNQVFEHLRNMQKRCEDLLMRYNRNILLLTLKSVVISTSGLWGSGMILLKILKF